MKVVVEDVLAMNHQLTGGTIAQRDDDDSSAAFEELLQSRIQNLLVNVGNGEYRTVTKVGSMDCSCDSAVPEDGEVLLVVTDGPPTAFKQHLPQDDSDCSRSSQNPHSRETQPETPPSIHSEPNSSPQSNQSTLIPTDPAVTSPQRPTTPNIVYRPFSCYSPQRQRSSVQSEILGMSLLNFVNNYEEDDASIGERMHELLSEDDNSEAALEMAAQQIRMDLLHTEMLELADAAEQAAEAGEDHFAAKPCIFEKDVVQLPRPYHMRRSYSEGATTQRAPRKSRVKRFVRDDRFRGPWSQTKLSVVDLRDVNEVFPSFRQFHTHLRTHLYRGKVSSEQLLFEESDNRNDVAFTQHRTGLLACKGSHLSPAAASLLPLCLNQTGETTMPPDRIDSSRSMLQSNFLETFRLDRWVPSRSRDDELDESTAADVLSNEIATEPPTVRPQIQIPPGLEALEHPCAVSATRATRRGNFLERRDDKMLPESTGEYMEKKGAPPTLPEIPSPGKVPSRGFQNGEPKALFDMTDSVECVEVESITSAPLLDIEPIRKHTAGRRRNSITAPEDDWQAAQQTAQPDFVTPARLRKIRRPRAALMEELMLPSNSLSDDSPTRLPNIKSWRTPGLETVLDVSDSLTNIDSRDNSTIVLPSFIVHDNDEEQEQDVSFTLSNYSMLSSSGFQLDQSADTRPSPETRSGRPSRRTVKLSVYQGSAEKHPEEKRSLQHSQIISFTRTPSHRQDELVSTPQNHPDCACMALSPASSEFAPPVHQSPSNNEKRRPSPPLRGSVTTFSVAMDMIAQLSPRSKREFRRRALYVRAKENDDFVHNFLYCSKQDDGDQEGDESTGSGCEPCTDGNVAYCGDQGFCCTSILDDAIRGRIFFPKRRHARGLVRLGSTADRDPDNWFEMATERVDEVLDQWVGGVSRDARRFRCRAFQAPSLKKSTRGSLFPGQDDSLELEALVRESDAGEEKKIDALYDVDDL